MSSLAIAERRARKIREELKKQKERENTIRDVKACVIGAMGSISANGSDCKNWEELEKEQKERERKEAKLERIKLYAATCNIPERHKKANLKPITALQKEVIEAFGEAFRKNYLKEMMNVVLCGSVGVGKTWLACGMIKSFIKSDISAEYITENSLLALHRKKDYRKIEYLQRVSFLAIDEIAAYSINTWEETFLPELLAQRHDNMLPTIIISNLAYEKLKGHLGSRYADRLRENGAIVLEMNGESLRGKQDV